MELGEGLARRAQDPVLWLGTVSAQGRPTVRPVWFVFDGDEVIVFSTPDGAKVRHLQTNPNVVLSFTTDERAAHVFVVSGTATVTHDGPPASSIPSFLAKYEEHYAGIGLDRDGVDTTYSTRITITPTSSWGW